MANQEYDFYYDYEDGEENEIDNDIENEIEKEIKENISIYEKYDDILDILNKYRKIHGLFEWISIIELITVKTHFKYDNNLNEECDLLVDDFIDDIYESIYKFKYKLDIKDRDIIKNNILCRLSFISV